MADSSVCRAKGEVVGDGYWKRLADDWRCNCDFPSSSPYMSVGVGVSSLWAEYAKFPKSDDD